MTGLVMHNKVDYSYSWDALIPPSHPYLRRLPGPPHSRDHPNTHLSTLGLLSEEYC